MVDSSDSDDIIRQTLYRERLSTGSHHFFIDLKRATNGSLYLVIDQRKQRSGQYTSSKMRIFEDEMLEFQRVLGKMIHISHNYEPISIHQPTSTSHSVQSSVIPQNTSPHDDQNLNLYPLFYEQLLSTHRWDEFEEYTYYLIKLIGVQTAYKFLGERQAGKADGFFKFGNLAVIYDCTLNDSNLEEQKQEQIQNYCHRLQSGRIDLSGNSVEAFHKHHKHVWIITRNQTRLLQSFNDILVKEVSVQDLMTIYQERLRYPISPEQVELKLRML